MPKNPYLAMSKSKAATASAVREYADEEEEDILSVDSDANPSDAEEDEDEDEEEEVRAKSKKPAAKKVAVDEDEDDEDESAGDNESVASSDEDSAYGSDLEREPVNKSGVGVGLGSAAEGKFAFDLDEFADEGEEDDDDDENYLQKFDESTKTNIISQYHPELQVHNYDEVDALSRVVRNERGLIVDPLHRTLPFITKYEKARILGERAKQLNSGAKAFVELDEGMIDGYLIALKEFDEKKIPFIIRRPLPGGGCEYWKFRDLEIL